MKKVFGVLTAVFLFCVCGVLSACGNKYADMEFKIYYAFEASETEWYDGTDGISLNYGNTNDSLVFDTSTGTATVYLKIEVNNVKAKYLDDITISYGTNSTITLSSNTVSAGEVFMVYISGNATTTFKIYETNSRKSAQFSFGVYESLKGIAIDYRTMPAVSLGGSVTLSNVNNISYSPNGTNQTGVTYSLDSAGYFNGNNEYVSVNSAVTGAELNEITGLLSVKSDYDFSRSTSVLCVKVTSTYNAEIFNYFYVYLTENLTYSPTLTYTNTKNAVEDYFTLYVQSSSYSSTTLTVDYSDFTSVYNASYAGNIYAGDTIYMYTYYGQVSYELKIYIDGKEYDTSSPTLYRGIYISKDRSGNFVITLPNQDIEYISNKITFSLEISDLDFSISQRTPSYEKSFTLYKSVLATGIDVNGTTYDSTNTGGTISIYSTQNSSYQGASLSFEVQPLSSVLSNVIEVTFSTGLTFSSSASYALIDANTNTYAFSSGDSLYAVFTSTDYSSGKITVKTSASPSSFEGVTPPQETITVVLTVQKVVTADKIEIYSEYDNGALSGNIANSTFYIPANSTTNTSSIYVKTSYTGTELGTSTIKFTSSNSAILFANGSSEIYLNDSTISLVYTNSEENYNVYQVSFKNASTTANSTVLIEAGLGTVGVSASCTVSAVYLAVGESFEITTSSSEAELFGTASGSAITYAITRGNLIEFEIAGQIYNTTTISSDAVSDISISVNTNYSDGNVYSTTAVNITRLSTYQFSLTGLVANKTEVFNITISYYGFDTSGNIELKTETILFEIAVYNPISSISTTSDENEIAYINSLYTDSSSTTINYTSSASTGSPSSTVTFIDTEEDDVTSVTLTITENIDIINVSTHCLTIKYVSNDGNTTTDLTNALMTNNGSVTLPSISGQILVVLSAEISYSTLTFTFTANRFGEASDVVTTYKVSIVSYEPASGITVDGDVITDNDKDSYYIYMSFLGVADGGSVSVQFTAEAYYSDTASTSLRFEDLGSLLYEVERDSEGNIVLTNGVASLISPTAGPTISPISSDGIVTITADKANGGGLYKLVLVTKDSYNDATGSYGTTFELFIKITDGTATDPYIISSYGDLISINNDLTAHYVLGADIDTTGYGFTTLGLNGSQIVEFAGSLSGTEQTLHSDDTTTSTTYTLTLQLTSAGSVTDYTDVYLGLFASLGREASVHDLDIVVTFETGSISSTNTEHSLYIGTVAGKNDGGTIENVNINIKNETTTALNGITTAIYFGGVVGYNAGTIDLKNSTITASNELQITANSASDDQNYGMVAGFNSGVIVGDYAGKSSLNEIRYSVIAKLAISNTHNTTTATTPTIYAGAVVGTNDGGSISGILTTGSVSVSDGTVDNLNKASGYLGGIAGLSMNALSDGIETCAILGLDLTTSCSSVSVAGIVGKSTGTKISDVRVMSAKNESTGTTGVITGGYYLAGIVAESYNDVIYNAMVENFNTSTDGVYYTLVATSDTTIIGGIVACLTSGSTTTIEASFFSANIDASATTATIYTTSSVEASKETNTYFLGQIVTKSGNYTNVYNNASATSYAVIYSDNSIFVVDSDANNHGTTLTLSEFYSTDTYFSPTADSEYRYGNLIKFIDLSGITTISDQNSLDSAITTYGAVYTLNGTDYVSTATYEDTTYYVLGVYATITINNQADLDTAKSTYGAVYTYDGSAYSEANTYSESTVYYVLAANAYKDYISSSEFSIYEADTDGDLTQVTTTTEFDSEKDYYILKSSFVSIFGDLYTLDNSTYTKNTNTSVINITKNYYAITLNETKWETYATGLVTDMTSNTNWAYENGNNIITIGDIVFSFPYLVDSEGNTLMVERPTSIEATLNQDEIANKNSIYVASFSLTGYSITETAIINYYNYETNPLLNEGYNTYEISNLVDFDILPTNASEGVAYMIISGSTYATISGTKIIFLGISGSTPIVVKCYSMFNSEVVEYVVFYTQYGITDLTLSSNAGSFSSTGEDITVADSAVYEVTTYTGSSAVAINFGADNGTGFSTILDANISNALKLDYDVTTGSNDLVSVTSTSPSVLDGVTISLNDTSFSAKQSSVIITFNLYLNLTAYFGLEDEDNYVLIASTTLRIVVYKSATGIALDGSDSYEIQTDSNLSFSVTLETGYGSVTTDDLDIEYTLDTANDKITLTETDKDSIVLSFSVEAEDAEKLTTLLTQAGVDSVVELFEFAFSYEVVNGGYKYNVSLNIKDNFNYRYITDDIDLVITISALTDSSISTAVELTLTPVKVTTAKISNYTAKNVTASTTYIDLIDSNSTETSIISPGAYGGVMVVNIEPAYANVVSATLASSSIYVPSLGKSVSIIFEQLVYNTSTGKYETLYPASTTENGVMTLQLVSTITTNANGSSTYAYTGVIYVHTILEAFSGLEATMTVTLTITTEDSNTIVREKTLLTQYLPGTSFSYGGLKVSTSGDTSEYLVQENSYYNNLQIVIYGYQFNGNPTLSMQWYLEDFDEDSFDPNNIANGQYYFVTKNGSYDYSTLYYMVDNTAVNEADRYVTYKISEYVNLYMLNDATTVTANADGSYTLTIQMSVFSGIPASFKITASISLAASDTLITSDESSIIFHPTDYLLSSATIDGLTSGVLNMSINSSRSLSLSFTTENENYDASEEIYQKLIDDLTAEVESNASQNGETLTQTEIYERLLTKLASLFYYSTTNGITTLADTHSEYNISYVIDSDGIFRLVITGLTDFSSTIHFSVNYGYTETSDGKYELVFGTPSNNTLSHILEASFSIRIKANTTEDQPIPIYETTDMFDTDGNCLLSEGADYILMNDLVFDYAITPIDVAIASFDGNNRTITITSFKVDSSATSGNYGLFATLGTYTDGNDVTQSSILKNVIVDYSQFTGLYLTTGNMKSIVFGGLVAVNDGGIIYNCDVMNLDTTGVKTVNIYVDNSNSVTIVFGGLVGENDGIVTNSRVGRMSYTRIAVDTDTSTQTSTTVYGEGLSFVVTNGSTITEGDGYGYIAIEGAFAGTNSGSIASSYVVNTSLYNYSMQDSSSMTAGFVANNSGTISYCYIKAREDTLSSTQPYSTGALITSMTNGSVAGFVYENSGEITNSYSNTQVQTYSAYSAGFVYNNTASGSISVCYSACTFVTVTSTTSSGNPTSEQPFVGINEKSQLLSYGEITNCYYLTEDDNSFVLPTSGENADRDQATGLNAENFTDSENLHNFVFILSTSRMQRTQGIWSYYNANDSYRILPELTNANTISYSYRYLLDISNDEFVYTNAIGYELGSANNPYIVRNVEEYNSVFTSDGEVSNISGYVRFVNDIDFSSSSTAIQTRVNYTLGDTLGNSVTSIDGNGMTISGIYLDVDNIETTSDSIGLFANIVNTYIKNLNLEFASTASTGDQFSSVSVKYSGGLAGTISDSVIININLEGSSTTIAGKNFAGGLAGMISGSSLVYGITSNVSVRAVYTNTSYYMYYSQSDFTTMRAAGVLTYSGNYESYLSTLSYAGGIAGVIDITSRGTEEYNISYIEIHGDEMYDRSNSNGNILADYAGGVAGYAGSETASYRLKYYTGTTDLIRGTYAAGGLYAVAMGEILASQVTAEEDTQYDYDTAMGKYVIALSKGDSTASVDATDTTSYGNLNLIESYGYAGGLVGIGIDARINSCYAKVGFKMGETIGGIVGLSVISSVVYAYAIPYVNLTSGMKYVGGIVGSAYGIKTTTVSRNNEISEYVAIVNYLLNVGSTSGSGDINTDLQFTFSTVLVNNADLSSVNGTLTTDTAISIDYICPDYTASGEKFITSNLSEKLTEVYYGSVSYTNSDNLYISIGSSFTSSAVSKSLATLYDLSDSEQESTYEEIFAGWDLTYWSLDNTKYFPLLLNEEANNYILIDSWDDFYILENNPDGKYMIVVDLLEEDMENWFEAHPGRNYVFDIDFTGTLIGQKSDGTGIPTIYGLKITASTENDGAGLFRSTTGATITNINFEWSDGGNGAIQSSVNLGEVSGLSGTDNNSLFTNISVSVSGEGYLYKDSETITGFGGLIGSAEGTDLISCSFNGNVSATLSTTDTDSTINVGGLVAYAQSASVDTTAGGEALAVWNLTISGCTVGDGNNDLELIFTIPSSSAKAVNIGGAIGGADTVTLSNITVGSSSAPVNISLTTLMEQGNIYYGGLVGYSRDSQISASVAYTTIALAWSGASVGTISTVAYVGGLLGYYTVSSSDSVKVINSNSSSEISISGTHNLVYVSAGVGYTAGNAGVDVEIEQCLFTGEVNSENESSAITSIYAGGAVGASSSGVDLVLTEVMSTADLLVGSSAGKNLYAGGLVGYCGDVEITASVSSGKIVAIMGNADTDASDVAIYLGGLVGNADKATLNYVYTVTSLLTDDIYATLTAEVNSGALFGGLTKIDSSSASETYYSTDYALATEETEKGKNLVAYTLVFGANLWDGELIENDSNYFTEVANTSNLPVISSLVSDLLSFGILKQTNAGYEYNTSGTSLNPVVISDTGTCTFSTSYTYYIINPNATTLTFTGVLNGVLIGGDHLATAGNTSSYDGYLANLFEIGTSSVYYNSTYGTVSGVIAVISSHSAVSNLHIYLETSSTITTGEITATGVITGLNDGVVFNCSVQGDGITVDGPGAQFGIIAGENRGVVSYCYSSAEIISSVKASGIVYKNAGAIASCYFTGYIENNSTTAAGIVGEYDNTTNYVYNSYMAGVIVNLSTTGNSFVAGDISGMNGSNNYIDALANIEEINDAKSGILTTTTSELMSNVLKSNAKLAGSWTTTLEAVDSTYIVNTGAETYGYNYLYPVYDFNKYTVNSGYKKFSCTYYQTYTGKGFSTSATETNSYLNYIYDTTNNAQAVSLTSLDYFLIPHLGVFSAVQGLLQESTSLNYMFIYDIDGTTASGSYISWVGIGSGKGVAGDAFYASCDSVTGVFVSNKYRTKSYQTTNAFTLCKISNLSGNGLFGNLGTVYIGYLTLGNFSGLTSSGAVANTANGTVTLQNITFASNTTISGVTGTTFGGLFGEIGGTVNLKGIKTGSNDESSNGGYYVTLSGTGCTTGLIAGTMTGGTLNFLDTSTSYYYARFDIASNISYGGGLIGEMRGGMINGQSGATYIRLYTSNDNSSNSSTLNLGGIVGKASGGEVNYITVSMAHNTAEGCILYIASFGGLVNTVEGAITFSNCSVESTYTVSIVYAGDSNSTMAFGLLAAQTTAALTVKDFIEGMSEIDVSAQSNNYNSDSIGIGVLIGIQNSNLKLSCSEINLTLTVASALCNVGGITGYYKSGTFEINSDITYDVKLKASRNVGGAFGYANAIDIDNIIENYAWGFLMIDTDNDDKSFAEITVEETTSNSGNIGGLIGYYSGSSLESSNENKIISANNIIISSATTQYEVKNVGGVVGYIASGSATTITNVKYSGSITVNLHTSSTTTSGVFGNYSVYNYQEDAESDGYYTIKSVNVGGIVGSVGDETTITDCVVSGTITGYQNVGGIIGYIPNDVAVTITSEDTSLTNCSGSVMGIINVGGVVGYLGNSGVIESIKSSASVGGNASVGGIAGYAYRGTITGVDVDTVVVNGNYYGIVKFTESDDDPNVMEDKTYLVMPTSVGGLVGTAESATLTNNTLENVTVNSAQEGTITGADATSNTGSGNYTTTTISTVSNYIMVIELYNSSQYNAAGYGYYASAVTISTDSKRDYSSTTSGFGGFVGSVDSATATNASGNSMSVTISASLGVNVGTSYGYYLDTNSSISFASISFPTLSAEKISVGGGYNVGGVIGYLDTASSCDGTGASTVQDLSTTNLMTSSTSTKITLQSGDVIGMYVGGLIGKLKASTVLNLTNTTSSAVNILINAENSYYAGGLVGYLQFDRNGASLTGGSVSTGVTTAIDEDNDSTVSANFGGIVGLLKVGGSGSSTTGFTITVTGTHNYAFTVNTIENTNYYDAETTYDADDSNNALYLVAQAYYVNLDTFNISATSRSDWYVASATNPLNSSANGWAKEYTLFKTLQRCIPKSGTSTVYNNADWDSIAVIYDAGYITAVGTVENLNLANTGYSNENDSAYTTYTTNNPDDTEITYGDLFGEYGVIYTVYEDYEDNPTLYSRIGQASLCIDSNGNYLELSEDSYAILNNKDANEKNLIFVTYNENDMIYNTTEIAYYIENYLGENNTAYFVFQVLYENSTIKYESDEYCTSNYLPSSGSIFDVTGLISSAAHEYNYESGESGSFWSSIGLIIAGVIVIGVSVAFAILTAGTSVALSATLITVMFTIGLGSGLATTICGIVNTIEQIQENAQISVKIIQYEKYGTSYGFVSSTYAREAYYQNGVIISTTDETTTENGITYLYYSSTRPSDFYECYYFVMGYEAVTDVTLGSPISKAEGASMEPNGDGSYTFEATNGSSYTAYRYYIYKNGVYYICSYASTIKYIPDQSNFKASLSNYTLYADYIIDGGYYYVRGSYSAGTYSYAKTFGNNLESDYSVNGTSWENTAAGKVGLSAEVTKSVYFKYDEDFVGSASKINGYAYLTGAYYTANGNSGMGLYGTATFTKYTGTGTPSGTYGIDYFTIYVYNSTTQQYDNPCHYVISSVGSTGLEGTHAETENTKNLSSITSSSYGSAPASFTVYIYPYSFKDPYNNFSGNAQDNGKYYTPRDDDDTTPAISYNVTYYYYDGGYKLGSKFDSTLFNNGEVFEVLFTNTQYTYTKTGSGTWKQAATEPKGVIEGSVSESSEGDSRTFDTANVTTLTIYSPDKLSITCNTAYYDSDLNPVTLSDAEVTAGWGDPWYSYTISYATLAKNFSTFAGCYIISPAACSNKTNWESVSSYYTVKYNYQYDSASDSIYVLSGTYSASKGTLSYMTLSYPDADYADYNFNKYALNTRYGVYSRYYYTNWDGRKKNGWHLDGDIDTTYDIIPSDADGGFQGYPNNGTPTYFVESVCVTMSGNVYQTDGSGYKTIEAGGVNVS